MTAPPRPRPFRRRVLLNTAATGVANVWAMVVALVSLPLLLHGLGAEGFGLWVLLQTFSALNGWLSLGDLGLATATPRFVAEAGATTDDGPAVEDPESAAEGGDRTALMQTSLTLFTLLGAGWALLLALLGPVVLPEVFDVAPSMRASFETAVVLVAVTAAVDQVTRGCQACLEGLQRVDLSRTGDMVRRTAGISGATVAALVTHSLATTALAALAGSLVGLTYCVLALRHTASGRLFGFDRRAARRLFGYARTVAALKPIGVIHRMMDRVIVGVALGPTAVAVVEIATQVQNGADAILSASSYAVVPSAAHARARRDGAALRDLLLTGTRYSLLATLPFLVVPALLSWALLDVWVGPDGAEAAIPVVLALAYVAVTAPLQVGTNLLVGTGRASTVLRATGATVAVNLALSLALVGPLGVSGVFVATLVSAAFLVPVMGRAVLRAADTDLRTFRDTALAPVIRPSLALAAAAAVASLATDRPLVALTLALALGLPAYAVATLRSALRPGELTELRTVLAGPAGAS